MNKAIFEKVNILGHVALVLAASVLLTGCDLFKPEALPSPSAMFHQIEQQMLDAALVEIDYQLLAEGAFTANLVGKVTIAKDNTVNLTASGTFGGKAFELTLSSENGVMHGGAEAGAVDFRDDTPAFLSQAMLVGATRMGLLHNHALLTAGVPPDHATGGVMDWVRVSDFEFEALTANSVKDALPVSFELTVEGVPSGQATLWVDNQTGLPVQRDQAVQFGDDIMMVTETYLSFKIQ